MVKCEEKERNAKPLDCKTEKEVERKKKHKSKQTKQSTTINYFIMMILNKVLVWM